MSKRVPVYLSEEELEHIKIALEEMPWATEGVDSDKLKAKLEEQLEQFDEE